MCFADDEAEFRDLKAMAKNVIAYFYPQDSDSVIQATELLDMLPTRSHEVIISNMRKASSLTPGILMSFYPRANLDAVGEGFAASCAIEEVGDLVQSFIEIATQVIEMIPVSTS
jgi:hypothetical protein